MRIVSVFVLFRFFFSLVRLTMIWEFSNCICVLDEHRIKNGSQYEVRLSVRHFGFLRAL